MHVRIGVNKDVVYALRNSAGRLIWMRGEYAGDGVARESKRTIAKVSAPVPLVMGQVLRFYVVALRC